ADAASAAWWPRQNGRGTRRRSLRARRGNLARVDLLRRRERNLQCGRSCGSREDNEARYSDDHQPGCGEPKPEERHGEVRWQNRKNSVTSKATGRAYAVRPFYLCSKLSSVGKNSG